MAVEKKRVIDRIKAKWPNLNLSQTRLDAMADKLALRPADDADDAAIDAVLDAQNEILSFEDIAKTDDRNRTLEAENKKLKEKTPNPEPPAPEPPTPDDAPEYVKKLFKKLDDVTTELDSIKKGEISKTKSQQVKDLLSKSDVFKGLKPEQLAIFEKSIDLDSEQSFEDQIKNLESTALTFIQSQKDGDDYAGPAGGGEPKNVDEKAVSAVVDNILGQ